SDDYFATLGIPLLAGRDFDHRDTRTSARVAIVNEAMAKKFFATPAAVGRRFQKEEGSSWSTPVEVVGVVATTKYRSLRDSAQPIMYFPRGQESIATLSGFFGALAVILATIGLYGIMGYNVARRRNEIGVRIALGAERSRVIRLVLREVATIVLAGVAIGMGLSLGLARLVVAFLYGVAPWDVATFASAAVVLVAVGLAAAALPAWRASRLDPVAALREE
ncbi:MAG: hypothetical protein DMD26_18915, partial [Gemmatimonadetes bacterium]